MPSEYPKRGAFFAHKFVRLVIRYCAAQEIGPDGCWLLSIIAHTEDAKRYAAPVTYWNEQLIPLLGFASWKQLDRVRDKCVSAGWLHYERESKRSVGRYWVTMPDWVKNQEDVDVSCDADTLLAQNDQRTENEWANEVANERENEGVNERRMNGRTFYPVPVPLPLPNTNTPLIPQGGTDEPDWQLEPPQPTTKPQPKPAPYSPAFERFWTAYPDYRKTGKGAAWRAWQKAIRGTSAETIIAAAEEYAASSLGKSQYSKQPATWINQRCWEDSREAWTSRPSMAPQEEIPF